MDLGALSISLAVKDLELDEFETHVVLGLDDWRQEIHVRHSICSPFA